MDGTSGFAGWRRIFIIEGLPSRVVSVPAKFLLAGWPEQARFLTAEDLLLRNSSDAGDAAPIGPS